jgi:signal transduction histidine kinase
MLSGAIIALESPAEMARRYPSLAENFARSGDAASATVPLLLDNRAIGVLHVVFRAPRRFTEASHAFLLAIGQQCAQALDRARLYEAEQSARRAAEEAVQLRDVFFSVAAHELKTPLTALLGRAQLLQRRAARDGHLDDRDAHAVAVIVAQAQRVNQLVTTMLDVARIEQGRLSIAAVPLDLCELVVRVVDEIRPTLERHTIDLDYSDTPLLIVGDPLRLEQVVQNLLDNAMKYSPAGGAVSVRLRRSDGYARLSISDQGVGIPVAAMPSLFERFYRADSTNPRQVTGLGVGLYVVREVVSQHGGAVSVESAEGHGSTFTVSLPLANQDSDTL